MPTFAELEGGRYSTPADIYEFTYGPEKFRFTSAAEVITFGGGVYTPIEIKRSAPTLNPRERRNTKVNLEVNLAERPFSDYIGIQPARKLECLITRVQLDETAGAASPMPSPEPAPVPATGFVLFDGYVTSISFNGRIAKVDMNPFNEQFSREVPRAKFQGLCNHVLYDSFCGVDKNLFNQTGLVNGVLGNTITVSGFIGTSFTGGYVVSAAGNDYRMIIQQSNDVLTLLLPFSSAVLGTTVTAYQGCDHSVTTCRDKFSNVTNYGGFPLVPGVNPFGQGQFTKS